MKRVIVFSVGAAVFAASVALFAPRTNAAVPKPTPTPTPVALQYDEISRMVVAPATVPPPGVFQDDYKLAMTPNGSATAQNAPQPPRHRGLGGMIGNVLSGNPMGAAEDAAADRAGDSIASSMMGGAMGNAMQMIGMLRNGHVVRYTYYYTKSWIREEDPLAQTATISKCQQHQFISLDLAKKTYRISDTTPKGCDTMPKPSDKRAPQVRDEAPGTVDMTVKSAATNLGPKTLDSIATTGNRASFELAMTNATGSCKNGDMTMETVTYVSGIHKPRAYCPLVTPKYVATGPGDIVRGGCKPTFHGSASGFAMNRSSDLLEMYMLMTMSGGDNAQQAQANEGKFHTLLERGNVAWLYRPQADPLFEIPAGFTEAK